MTTARNRELVAKAQPYLDRGFTVAQAAAELGLTKGALSGAIFKVKKGRRDKVAKDNNNWDRKLFEPWAERKARKL